MSLTFEEERVKEVLEKHNVKLPEKRPTGTRIGMMPNETIVIAQTAADPEKILLTVDSTRDYDLTNDQPKTIPVVEEWKSESDPSTKIVVKIDK